MRFDALKTLAPTSRFTPEPACDEFFTASSASRVEKSGDSAAPDPRSGRACVAALQLRHGGWRSWTLSVCLSVGWGCGWWDSHPLMQSQGDSRRVRSPLDSNLGEAVEESQHGRGHAGAAWAGGVGGRKKRRKRRRIVLKMLFKRSSSCQAH